MNVLLFLICGINTQVDVLQQQQQQQQSLITYINKHKSNEMNLDCLLYHLIPPTCFGRHRPSSGWLL
jgi:hypothetical protein